MSQEVEKKAQAVMERIHREKIKMRSKTYFVIGSIATAIGLIASMVISVFFVGLVRFSLRTHGPMGSYRFDQMIALFPWWIAGIAGVGFVLGIWLLRRYDFSYKIHFKAVVIVFLLSMSIAGWIVDTLGLNDMLFRQGPNKGIMRQYFPEGAHEYRQHILQKQR